MGERPGDRHGDGTIYQPHQVAAQLGLSDSGLRRLAPVYERVCGPLPRDERRGRAWTSLAVDRLRRAREAVRTGRAASVQAALVAEMTDDLPPGLAGDDPPPPNTIAELVAEIRGLRLAVEAQNRALEAQAERLRAIESDTPGPRESDLSPGPTDTPTDAAAATHGQDEQGERVEEHPSEPRPWWRRLLGG